MSRLTDPEYRVLDDVLALLIDAKAAGAPVTDEHLVLLIRLQAGLHEHTIAQRYEDDVDVAYCTTCGASWGTTRIVHHGLPAHASTEREDGIDWPVWICRCGCGSWGARW